MSETTPGHTAGVERPVARTARSRPWMHYLGRLGSRIAGVPAPLYLVLAGLVVIAAVTGNLPDTMVVGFAATMLLGGLFVWIASLFPVVRDFGLPAILCLFAPTTLAYFGLMPENLITVVQNFVDGYGFLDLFVVGIIAGSILGMPRALLLKAGPRFAVPVVGSLIATFVLVGLLGAATGFGFIKGILFIAAPIMAGGLAVGALPMSEMYGSAAGGDSATFMGDLMSAALIANMVCILIAGIYNGLGKRRKQFFVGFNGHGQLLRIKGRSDELAMPPRRDTAAFLALGKGLLIAGGLFVFGNLAAAFVPALHPYAWTIIAAAIVKIFGLLPQDVEDGAAYWGDLLGAILVPALLVGVSLTFIKFTDVLASLSDPLFILLTICTVLIATLSSGILGWLVKFNFVEASITPGLVMADSGGSGDVAVLSAADRMHLMPFAALTNRVGGALVLFVTSLIVPFLT